MKNPAFLLVLSVALAITAIPNRAHGIITFTETDDFSGNLGSPFIIPEALGIGANTITGSLPSDMLDPFATADRDVFHVNNSSGLTVSSITVDITNFVGTTTEPLFHPGGLRLEDPGFDQESVFENGQFSLVATPADASVFEFRFAGPEDITNSEAGSMDYVVTINAVPEPSQTGILIGAMVFWFCLRRRRCRLDAKQRNG